ncbi:hypothetical protein H632_c4020p0, partial [Helicosporidium sp. ATCC 50920]
MERGQEEEAVLEDRASLDTPVAPAALRARADPAPRYDEAASSSSAEVSTPTLRLNPAFAQEPAPWEVEAGEEVTQKAAAQHEQPLPGGNQVLETASANVQPAAETASSPAHAWEESRAQAGAWGGFDDAEPAMSARPSGGLSSPGAQQQSLWQAEDVSDVWEQVAGDAPRAARDLTAAFENGAADDVAEIFGGGAEGAEAEAAPEQGFRAAPETASQNAWPRGESWPSE